MTGCKIRAAGHIYFTTTATWQKYLFSEALRPIFFPKKYEVQLILAFPELHTYFLGTKILITELDITYLI